MTNITNQLGSSKGRYTTAFRNDVTFVYLYLFSYVGLFLRVSATISHSANRLHRKICLKCRKHDTNIQYNIKKYNITHTMIPQTYLAN